MKWVCLLISTHSEFARFESTCLSLYQSRITEEDTRIIGWMKETRSMHPHLLWIDDMGNLDAFLERSYSYVVAQQAIDAAHLGSLLHVPEYYLLPKGTSVSDSLHNHRMYDSCSSQ